MVSTDEAEALSGRAKVRADQAATFLAALRQGLTIGEACTAAKLVRRTAYKRRTGDAAFRAAWDEAYETGNDAIEAEVHRRAVTGWDEPVFQQGKQVGTIKKHSDRMLELLAKKRIPAFRDHQKVELELVGQGARMAERLTEARRKLQADRERTTQPGQAPSTATVQ